MTEAKLRTGKVANEGATHAASVSTGAIATASALDTSGPAGIAPATDFSTSGAPRQTSDIPVDHPAVDNDPRAGTTANQNRADFNDPSIEGHEAVERALQNQAKA